MSAEQLDIFQANPISAADAESGGWVVLADAPSQDEVEILTSEGAHFTRAVRRDGVWMFRVLSLHGAQPIYYQIHGPMYWRPRQESSNG